MSGIYISGYTTFIASLHRFIFRLYFFSTCLGCNHYRNIVCSILVTLSYECLSVVALLFSCGIYIWCIIHTLTFVPVTFWRYREKPRYLQTMQIMRKSAVGWPVRSRHELICDVLILSGVIQVFFSASYFLQLDLGLSTSNSQRSLVQKIMHFTFPRVACFSTYIDV